MPNQSKPSTSPAPGQDVALPVSDIRILPRDLGSLFAQRPLIQGESEEEYDDLLSRVTHAVGPTDIIEAMWVKDIVDLVWEVLRLRRLKASLFKLAQREALLRLDDHTYGSHRRAIKETPLALARQWLAGDASARQRLSVALAERDLDLETILAKAMSGSIRLVVRIDEMIASAEARRNKVLTEMERRRETVARRLRTISDDVTDVA